MRIAAPGRMGTNDGTCDGFSTERDKLYYVERAHGGAAMIIRPGDFLDGIRAVAGATFPHSDPTA